MLKRLALAGAQRYFGGPGKSWVVTSGIMIVWRAVSSLTGRRETLDLSRTKPGDMIVIEHLPITHKAQIRQMKKDKKAEKIQRRTVRRDAKQNPVPKKSQASSKLASAPKVPKPSRKARREDKRDRRAIKRDARAQRRDKRQAKKVARHKSRVAGRSQKLARRAVRLEQRAARTLQRASKLK